MGSLVRPVHLLYLATDGETPLPLLDTPAPERARRPYHAGVAVAVILVILCCVAPTLLWQEFSTDDESINVATAMETCRAGNWLIPKFEGHVQLARPPLAAWFTATMLRSSTLQAIRTDNPDQRDQAYLWLAWEVRFPALLSSCLGLMAVFALGQSIGGTRVGVLAVIVCGTSAYFLRFCRQSTTDTHLFFWVTVTNAFLAEAMLEKATWRRMLGAGIAAAFAILSKGPVALVLTAAPVAAYVFWRAWIREGWEPWRWRRLSRRRKWKFQTILAALLAMISLSWFFWVRYKVPGAMTVWAYEWTGGRHTSMWIYASILLNLMPWLVFFLHGFCVTTVETAWTSHLRYVRWFGPRLDDEPVRERWALPVFLMIVPFLLMLCSPNHAQRDLLPLAPAAAIFAARSIGLLLDDEPYGPATWPHWLILLAIGLAVPIAGGVPLTHVHGHWATLLRAVDDGPWFNPIITAGSCLFIIAVLLYCVRLQRRRRIAVVLAGMMVMLFIQGLFAYGYGNSVRGRSMLRPIAEAALQTHPPSRIYTVNTDHHDGRAEAELSIYSNQMVYHADALAHVPPSAQSTVAVLRTDTSSENPPLDWKRLVDTNFSGDYAAYVKKR